MNLSNGTIYFNGQPLAKGIPEEDGKIVIRVD